MSKHNQGGGAASKPTPNAIEEAVKASKGEQNDFKAREAAPEEIEAAEAARASSEATDDEDLPASAQPATEPVKGSDPKPAGAVPATGLPVKSNAPKAVASEPVGVKIPRGKHLFPNHSDEYAEEMSRLVACHLLDDLSGSVGHQTFKFRKNEVLLLPKWFALTHPKRIVVKE